MPYRKYPVRRYRRRRRYKKPTRWDNYKTGLGQLASDVYKLKNMINVEFKYHDVTQVSDLVQYKLHFFKFLTCSI